MAEIQPLTSVRYELGTVGSLDAVAAPPYDVIDDALRAELLAKSPFNVVEIDLPKGDNGGDPYLHAETTFEAWLQQGVLVREREQAIWPIEQEFVDPYGDRHVRGGFLCRVRVEDYGPGRIRPHERTQPGPKEDRLRLTRATRANLSPIFSLYAGEPVTFDDLGEPFGSYTDAGGATTRVWRYADADGIASVQAALAEAELLIADGHHRYETARVYAEEVGGTGEHSYTLMCLCAMSDPGLTVLPTHRLLTDLTDEKREALRATIERDFEVEQVGRDDLEPTGGGDRIAFGYYDAHHRRPLRLTLKDPAIADRVLADKPASYRRLDTALLEAIVLRDTLGMTEDDVARQNGLTYAKRTDHAIDAVESGSAAAAFFMSATPVELVQEVAEEGESMPPKSTFFYPKIPTGLVFNPLE
jgi:uncharacterized protein (DUF1015 family)